MTSKRIINIGSRASKLALVQTNFVKQNLEFLFPEYIYNIKEIQTKGDKILSVSLSAIGDKGLFTQELESAILSKEIDFAVHSLKDMPTSLPEGLTIQAVTERENPQDVLISNYKFLDLPSGAKVGTSSLRRRAQLINLRDDLDYIDIRGNLNTRLKKLDDELYDAIVLAYAGVRRLNLQNRISDTFDYNQVIPAAGQGALAIETRQDDDFINPIITSLNHHSTSITTCAERTFLAEMQGGCQVPIGAIAQLNDDTITLTAFISSLDGKTFYKSTKAATDPVLLGKSLADELKNMGADVIIEQLMRK
ncbi:MAG: hydroxymethylbilane synthase [Vampirovibrionia bacterium]